MLDKNKPISYFNDVEHRFNPTISELEGFSSRYYTGIGSEIREDAVNNDTKVVVNLPQGLGRYDIASANDNAANTVPSFEWYLKNHLGSTMLVYGTQSTSDPTVANLGFLKAAYDYRAFGEQVDLTMPTDKVTETFTGKEKDDETDLSYFGARYLDQMLGMWVSVDAKRQFNSPYLYAGNGVNPVDGVDKDGNDFDKYGEEVYQVMQNGRLNESPINATRINRPRNDHSTLYNIIPSQQPRIVKVEPQEGYQKTYDVYIPIKPNEDYTDLSLITYILMGHELDHPYTPAKPGHNGLESVNSVGEYLDKIKQMSTDEKPDQIYLNDYKSADEMGAYEKDK